MSKQPREPRRSRIVELTLVGAILVALASIAVPNYHEATERDRGRSCYTMQKTVVGAIEMYNLDRNTKRTHLDARFFRDLTSAGYLRPGDAVGVDNTRHAEPYLKVFEGTTTGNGIRCRVHGSIE